MGEHALGPSRQTWAGDVDRSQSRERRARQRSEIRDRGGKAVATALDFRSQLTSDAAVQKTLDIYGPLEV